MNEGYFKKGEVIEASGSLYGLVTYSNEDIAEIRMISSTFSGNYLTDTKKIISNRNDMYNDAYYIKKLKEPIKPLKSIEIKSLLQIL